MPTIATNKKALSNYFVFEKLEGGIALFGHEVKSVKQGNMNLAGSYISIDKKNEAWLIGAHIALYPRAGNSVKNYDPVRPRKLLLRARELVYMSTKSHEKGLTILPISIYTKGSFIKVEIGIARGKKKYDKREDLKKRDIEREIGRRLKR